MQVSHQSLNVLISQTLEHKELAPSVSAFRLTRSVTAEGQAPAGFADVLSGSVVAGLAKTVDIEAFESGKAQGLSRDNRYLLLSRSYLQDGQKSGFAAAVRDEAVMDGVAVFNPDSMSALQDYDVVRVDYCDNMLFDSQDRPLPLAIYFDYTAGMIKDGCYELPRLVEHLKNNPQILPGPKCDALEIKPVPYYNVSPGCNSTVIFRFSPTHEQMQLLWLKAQEIKPKNPSTAFREAVFELDMLGLRAAGIARCSSFWENLGDGQGEEQD